MILNNVAAVRRYLKNKNWKISKTQIYEHVEQKKLKRNDEGYFSISVVNKYALKYLKKTDGSKPSKAHAEVQERKYEAEVRQYVASAELKEIKAGILKGDYVRKGDFERALAERALLFKRDIENFCRSKPTDIINLVDGKKEKIPDLIEYLLKETAAWLNCYAVDREFKVPAESRQLIEDKILKEEEDDDSGSQER